MKIAIINGPNLNRLGKREPEVYGHLGFDEYFESLTKKFGDHNLHYFQSNHEGELIDKIHEWGDTFDGIVVNPGGLTHTSVSLRDAIASVKAPFIEVHISNIHGRESFRHLSYISAVCRGTIAGLGLSGYDFAIQSLISK
jgi:3-dehydroquinate dehydratase-2